MANGGLPLTNEAIASMTEEQRSILAELGMFAAQELNLTKLIRDTTEEVRKVLAAPGFAKSERPKALHEDPEVDILISVKTRNKVVNVESQIRRTLARAVQLGLGDYRIIRQQCENYGVPIGP
jgi:hypothetical protein